MINTTLQCVWCGGRMHVNFEDHARLGVWPHCCGYTMRLKETSVPLGEASSLLLAGGPRGPALPEEVLA